MSARRETVRAREQRLEGSRFTLDDLRALVKDTANFPGDARVGIQAPASGSAWTSQTKIVVRDVVS